MKTRTRWRRLASIVLWVVVSCAIVALLAIAAGALLIRTGWVNNQVRELLLAQANELLDATVAIDRIEGSLFGGVRFVNVRVSRGGATVIAVDDISVTYSVRDLFGDGTSIRRLTLTRPRITLFRLDDGRWNTSGLVRTRPPAEPEAGPRRAVRIASIVIDDGSYMMTESVTLGAIRIPRAIEHLDVSLTVDYRSSQWQITLENTSWTGRDPALSVSDMAGALSLGPEGWSFADLSVRTPHSAFVLNGRVNRGRLPTALDLGVRAERFAFQEWAGIVPGLADVAVDASFDVVLQGPTERLSTTIDLSSTGGGITGTLVLNSRVPGWHGEGTLGLTRLDLARWLNQPDRPSHITGRVTFDMNLRFGSGFPRTEGAYSFEGPRVAMFGYEAAQIRARGQTTATSVAIQRATMVAYGATLQLSEGSVGYQAPFPFHFKGAAREVDLRRVPRTVPVPHVASRLMFAYDISGQFRQPFLQAEAVFESSTFLDATIGAGAVGTMDTLAQPFRYTGDGEIRDVQLHRFGTELEIAWLSDPRYKGTIAGRFRVEGTGGDRATRIVNATGRLDRADLFDGALTDADVTVSLEAGSLTAWYDGRFWGVNPAVAFDDARLRASLSGSTRAEIRVADLLLRTPAVADYDIKGDVVLEASTIRGVRLDHAELSGNLLAATLNIASATFRGPSLEAKGRGTIELDGVRESRFDYDIVRADLSVVQKLLEQEISGHLVGSGRLSGPLDVPRLVGQARLTRFELSGISALDAAGDFEVTIPTADLSHLTGRVTAEAAAVQALGRDLQQLVATVWLTGRALDLDARSRIDGIVSAEVRASAAVHANRQGADIKMLEVSVQNIDWSVAAATPAPTVSWDGSALTVANVEFVRGTSERISVSGTWRPDGGGSLQVSAVGVFLETFDGLFQGPTRYAGVIHLDATVGGGWGTPFVVGRLIITNGRIRRLGYERLAGRVDYANGLLTVDLRLDQSAGVWMTASGDVPLALLDRGRPEQPIRLALRSSPIDLGLVEGVTDVVRDLDGQMQVDVTVVGTSHDPHFSGSVKVVNAAFQVSGTGVRYRDGLASVLLDPDRVTVDALRLVDVDGDTLEVRGSLGTHELKVGDISIDANARGFRVLDNEFGRVDVDARVTARGLFESPRIAGDVTVVGGSLQVDTILDRMLFQPYATSATPSVGSLDAIAALNPWERLGLDIFLHVPGTLRLVGDNLQVAEGTPLGLGSFNLRAQGDPYLYKDPAGPMYVTGSLHQITGTYEFQGRRFDLDPGSSVNFLGDLNPEVWVTVTRVISGVETRVSIVGPLSEPELRLASTPPLDASDVLSLIVFNTSTNQLSAEQQQELAVRAGTLAAGFLATPLITALERSIGIDSLEIETGSVGRDVRVTIGDEIAPGLVARFSRQFGDYQYDEATVEYYLAQILRIRATFSDAGALVARSPFRRIERAGIDLLLFFSF